MVAEELESLRGRAYNFAGDAVVGVFGLQHTHDDDALRAVRAGLQLVERVGRLGQEIGLPVPLRVRVGIHTGPVAIGSEASEQGLLYGATVNMAARLQQAADPGTVLGFGDELPPLAVAGPVRTDARGRGEGVRGRGAGVAGRRAPTRLGAQDDPAREPQARAAAAAGRVRRRARDAAGPPGDAVRGGGDRQEPRRRRVRRGAPRGDEGPEGPGQSLRGGRDVRTPRADPAARDGGGGARAAGGAPGAARGVRPGMHLARRGAADRRAAVHRARHRRRGPGREALPRRRDPLGPARPPARVRQPGTGRRGARGHPGGADADARARRGAGARGRRHPAARRVRRAVLAVGRPPRVGRRARQLGQPVHGDAVARRLHAARARRGRGAGRGVRATDRAARRREPVLHHRDDRDAAAPRARGSRPTPARCRRRCCRRPCRP